MDIELHLTPTCSGYSGMMVAAGDIWTGFSPHLYDDPALQPVPCDTQAHSTVLGEVIDDFREPSEPYLDEALTAEFDDGNSNARTTGEETAPIDHLHQFNDPPTYDDWERIKPRLTELLYYRPKKALVVIAETLAQQGFRATVNMYKTRIRNWGLQQKFQKHEMMRMIAMSSQHKGKRKSFLFKLRGRIVTQDQIDQYQRKAGLRASEVKRICESGKLKECLDLQTISTSAPSSVLVGDAQMDLYERCLFESKAMVQGLLSSGQIYVAFYCIIFDEKWEDGWENWDHSEFRGIDPEAIIADRLSGSSVLTRRLGFLMESVVKHFNLHALATLLKYLSSYESSSYSSMARSLHHHFQRITISLVQNRQPQYKLLSHLTKLDHKTLQNMCLDLYKLMLDTDRETCSNNSYTGLSTRKKILSARLALGRPVEQYEACDVLQQIKRYRGGSARSPELNPAFRNPEIQGGCKTIARSTRDAHYLPGLRSPAFWEF